MRQLLYVSSSSQAAIGDSLSTILLQSRRNNEPNGLSGLLWTDGMRFLQVLEGEHLKVQATFDRIKADQRHKAVVVLHDRAVAERSFGRWSMALVEDSDVRIAAALKEADAVIRGTFEGFISARKTAYPTSLRQTGAPAQRSATM